MAGYDGRWALCGGWAVDAWLGRELREHHDVDFAVFHDEQRMLFEHIASWEPIGHDDNVPGATKEPWTGRWLAMPAHIHARREGDFEPEFHLNVRAGGRWVMNEASGLSLPMNQAVTRAAWGFEVVTPAVLVYYKAAPPTWRGEPRTAPRPHDEADFELALPLLSPTERRWVRDAIAAVEPAHPWLARL